MPNPITIEPAPKDAPETQALVAGLMALYDEIFTPEEIREFDEAEAGDELSEYAFFLARRGGRAVGCGALRLMEDGATGEVKRIFVDPGHREAGAAHALMSAIEREAAARGLSRIVLTTAERLSAAVRLYESMGYARIPNYGPYAGRPVIVSYEKRLA